MPEKPSEIEYDIGDRVTLRRGGRYKQRSVYVVTDIKSWRTRWGTQIYGLVKESNGFPTAASAADIQRAPESMQHLCECGHAKSEHGDVGCVHYTGKPGHGEFCTCLLYRSKERAT